MAKAKAKARVIDVDDPRRPETIEKPRFNAANAPPLPSNGGPAPWYLVGMRDVSEPWDIPVIGPILELFGAEPSGPDEYWVYARTEAIAQAAKDIGLITSWLLPNTPGTVNGFTFNPDDFAVIRGDRQQEVMTWQQALDDGIGRLPEVTLDAINDMAGWLGQGTAAVEETATRLAATAGRQMAAASFQSISVAGGTTPQVASTPANYARFNGTPSSGYPGSHMTHLSKLLNAHKSIQLWRSIAFR